MSASRNCLIIEIRPDNWYYVLERIGAPQHANDWMDHAQAFGPFATDGAASEHLFKYHSNPGSSETVPLPSGRTAYDFTGEPTLAALIEGAHSVRRSFL